MQRAEAIDEQRFELYYQPQINVVTGDVESLEALLRWNDPEHGLVSRELHQHAQRSAQGFHLAPFDWICAETGGAHGVRQARRGSATEAVPFAVTWPS